LQELERTDEAGAAFELVLKIDSKNFSARRHMASLKASKGQFEDAVLHLSALVDQDPENLALRFELAQSQASAGQAPQAIAQYRKLLEARPDWHAVANNLAWLLSTHPDERLRRPDEAIRLARSLCEASSYSDASSLDTLAAAFAARGRSDGAVSTARKALQAAKLASAPAEQIQGIEYRLQVYQAGEPYFEDPKRTPSEPPPEQAPPEQAPVSPDAGEQAPVSPNAG
jgi:tetratricopeptide (TPR) repeat protein